MALVPLNLQGEDGDNGTSATVSVGTVTTGAAGTSAAVTNAGTSSAAVLNFTIPRGATGAAGGYTSGPGYGTPVALDADDIVTSGDGVETITIPYPDANFTVQLDDLLVGETSFLRMRLPTLSGGAQQAAAHWVRVTVTVLDRRREVGSKWYRRATAGTYGSVQNRPTVIEPGPEPGSITTIDYEWIPWAAQWVVRGFSGDALVRHHTALAGWTRATGFTSALPAYASPELVRNYPSRVTDNLAALAQGVPSHIAAALAREECWVDLADATLDETIYLRWGPLGVIGEGTGGFRAVGYMSEGAILARAVGDGHEGNLKGFVLLHELAHAVDYYWYSGAFKMFNDGTLPSDALDYNGWLGFLYTRPDLQVSADPDLVDLHTAAKATGTLSAYYYNSASEWFAQMLAVVLSKRIAGYNTSSMTAVQNAIQGNATIYADFVTFVESVYIL
jgi:hypothetical protein